MDAQRNGAFAPPWPEVAKVYLLLVGIAAMPLSGAAGPVPAAAPPSSFLMSPEALTAYTARPPIQLYSLMYNWHYLLLILVLLNILLMTMYVCCILPSNNNTHQPPAWSPRIRDRYPFRTVSYTHLTLPTIYSV